MNIKSITVGGYKNIEKSKIEFDGIAALLAINNYGKSNFLESIDFGMDFISAHPKLRKNMMGYTKGMPLTPKLQNEKFFFEMEFHEPNLGEYCYVKYGFTFMWYRDDGSGAKIMDEWLETRSSESVRYTGFIKREKMQYRKSKDTQSFRFIPLDVSQLVIDILPHVQDAEISRVAELLGTIDYRICSSLDLRSGFQTIPFEYIVDQAEGAVAFDDGDIPRALYNLQQHHPYQYSSFEDAVFTLFPEFTKLVLRATDASAMPEQQFNSINMVISNGALVPEETGDLRPPVKLKEELYRLHIISKNLNQPISIANMSAGTKRIIWMLANVFIAACTNISVIGIEEIETSIHPRLLKSLLEILAQATNKTSIILSSHSPYLIQYLKITNLYIGVPNEYGVASFRRIKKNKSKQIISLSRELDMPVGEYLFEVLSKERNAKEILEQYLEAAADD